MQGMNTVTLPKNEYMQILETQEKLKEDLARLENAVSFIAQDEVSPTYLKRLEKISRGLDVGKGKRFSSVSAVRKYFKSL